MSEYIEREKALDAVVAWAEICPATAISEIGCMTAADVAPVVHGEWILVGTNEHDYETSVEEKCSLCGRYVYRYDTEPQDNFCPNCGAKIDGEGEESK